jgi:peptidoglycan/LPS O-acetylase OafA/YrhL
LDVVRFASAMAVLIYHAGQERFSGGWFRIPMIGTDAVMVFFVLSGFVIAYTSETKDRNISDYVISRLSRLWSILVPAVALTAFLDYIGLHLFSVFYERWAAYEPTTGHWAAPVPSALAASTFTNELWFKSTPILSDGPVWSLGYEFWYYAIFRFYLPNAASTRADTRSRSRADSCHQRDNLSSQAKGWLSQARFNVQVVKKNKRRLSSWPC